MVLGVRREGIIRTAVRYCDGDGVSARRARTGRPMREESREVHGSQGCCAPRHSAPDEFAARRPETRAFVFRKRRRLPPQRCSLGCEPSSRRTRRSTPSPTFARRSRSASNGPRVPLYPSAAGSSSERRPWRQGSSCCSSVVPGGTMSGATRRGRGTAARIRLHHCRRPPLPTGVLRGRHHRGHRLGLGSEAPVHRRYRLRA